MRPIRLAAILAAGFALAPLAHAESGNAILELKLKGTDLPFEVDGDGDFKVIINWTQDKRSQLVFVSPKVEEIGGVQTYTAFAPAFIEKDGRKLDAARMRSLLEQNADYKIGAWSISGNGLYFAAKLPTSVDSAQLRTLLSAVAEQADNLEMELTPGKDDL